MTEQALLRAIIDSPDDDVARLAYADWLDENDQGERAEFIRLQVEIARLPESDNRRAELTAREQELLAANEVIWFNPIKHAVDDWVFHRGMLGVATRVRQFLDYAELLTSYPAVHYIDIVDHAVGRETIAALAGAPHLARITILNLAGWYCYDAESDLISDEQAALLASSSFVRGLECLNLRCNAIRDEDVRAIATSPHLSQLLELDLRINPIRDERMLALASSSTLTGLESLDLSFNDGRVTEKGWRSLVNATGLPRLKRLCCAGNHINREIRDALRIRFGENVWFGTAEKA